MEIITRIQALRTRLPWLSLSLALLLPALQPAVQDATEALQARAVRTYLADGLAAHEAPNYLSHLSQTGQTTRFAEAEQRVKANNLPALAALIVADRDFRAAIDRTTPAFWGDSVYPQWRAAHDRQQALLAREPRARWGLSTAQWRFAPLITHGFLTHHAGQWILGSIGLLMAGLLIERRLGSLALLTRLAVGVSITGAVGLMLHATASTPFVGPEGMVAYLLGVALALRGRERIVLPLPGERPAVLIPVASLIALWATGVMVLGFSHDTLMLYPLVALSGLALGALSTRITDPVAVPDAAASEDIADREAMETALRHLSALQLRDAESTLVSLLAHNPAHGPAQERLAHVRAYLQGPRTLGETLLPALEALADHPDQMGSAQRLLALYRRDTSHPPLPIALRDRLIASARQSDMQDLVRQLEQDGRRKPAPAQS